MKKHIVLIAVLAVVIVAGGFLYLRPRPNIGGNESLPPQPQPTALINYTDAGFVPASGKIFAPMLLMINNKSSKPFWPVSANLSSTAPCANHDMAGACGPIAPGGVWWTKFNSTEGEWTYYDKLNPSAKVILKAYPTAF